MDRAKTIFALSSAEGRAGIAVWRVAGPMAGQILLVLTGWSSLPSPRVARYAVIRDPATDGRIDDGMVLWFPGPRSATGDDIAELHVHGSAAVGARLTSVLTSLGVALAAPGEFARRAFANGKMELLEVEALGDLLDAETDLQHAQAMAVLGGQSEALVAEWREGLLSALTHLEAAVDFPDEADIPAAIATSAQPAVERVQHSLRDAADASEAGRRLRHGISLAIVGPPNVGKSTLLNRLVGQDRAIVSPLPGTTRDVVTARLIVAGRLVEILDTAGLRSETTDPIELLGMERSRSAVADADVIIVVRDATADDAFDIHVLEDPGIKAALIPVANKVDEPRAVARSGEIPISAETGFGVDRLLDVVAERVMHRASPAPFSHERQIALLRRCAADLEIILSEMSVSPEVGAEGVRRALAGLDHLIGRVTTEEVLGRIFSGFCIGK